jgi:DNA-3-methyladenine glycosylase II
MKLTFPDYWQEAKTSLSTKDRTLKLIIDKLGDYQIGTYKKPFYTLLKSIVGQQVSIKSADAVWLKVTNHFKTLTPEKILAANEDELIALGLTRQKRSYFKNIAKYFIEHKCNHEYFAKLSEDEIRAKLLPIKGVGNWTIEMFLIFNQLKPNILPMGDIGLINSVKELYPALQTKEDIENYAKKTWQPWCTVATCYIWSHKDPDFVQY